MTTFRPHVFRSAIKAFVPFQLHFSIGRMLKRVRHFGLSRACPVCNSSVAAFLAHGLNRRPDAICPICESRDRHRLAWLFLLTRTDLFRRRYRLLHVSPEPEVKRRLVEYPEIEYVSVDIIPSGLVRADVAALPFGSESFDALYCCHVLNMVEADDLAMSEIARVLRPGGWALLQMPIAGATTVEPARPSTSLQRKATFGDPDIRRVYGTDVQQRLEAVGLRVSLDRFVETFPRAERQRFGLYDETLVLCSKNPIPSDQNFDN